MQRLLCCLAWIVLSVPIIVAFWLCLMLNGLFVGPREAARRCQPILDKLTDLANCCAGAKA